MTHLIDKSAVVAEIERVKEFYENIQKLKPVYESNIEDCNDLLSFIDTLEVREQLTWQDIKIISEIGESFMNSRESDTLNEEDYYKEILRRFKAQKGEEV